MLSTLRSRMRHAGVTRRAGVAHGRQPVRRVLARRGGRDARRSGPGCTPTRTSRWAGCGSPRMEATGRRSWSRSRCATRTTTTSAAPGWSWRFSWTTWRSASSRATAWSRCPGAPRPSSSFRSISLPGRPIERLSVLGHGTRHFSVTGRAPPQHSLRCPHRPLRGQRRHGLRQHLILTGAGFGAGRRAAARSSRSRWVMVTVTAPNSSSTLPRKMKGP